MRFLGIQFLQRLRCVLLCVYKGVACFRSGFMCSGDFFLSLSTNQVCLFVSWFFRTSGYCSPARFCFSLCLCNFSFLMCSSQLCMCSESKVLNLILHRRQRFIVRTATSHTPEFLGRPKGAWTREGGTKLQGKGLLLALITPRLIQHIQGSSSNQAENQTENEDEKAAGKRDCQEVEHLDPGMDGNTKPSAPVTPVKKMKVTDA